MTPVVWRGLVLVLALLQAGVRPQESAAPLAAAPAVTLAAAIDHLGSFDFDTRTDAARQLRRAPPEVAAPLLASAVRAHADEYVRFRALVLLTGMGDSAVPAVVRDVMGDRNDRLRTVAYQWLEHHPEADMTPRLLAALPKEQSEFVRPALTRALAAHASDPGVRAALGPLVLRGEDLFRGAVIEALGDYGGHFALGDILAVSKLDGPLQDDSITALGGLGDPAVMSTLRELQASGAPDLKPTIAATLCLLKVDCDAQETYLRTTLLFAAGRDDYHALVRGAVHALAVLAARGRTGALSTLFDAAEQAGDDARGAIAIGIGLAALRNPTAMLDALAAAPRRQSIATLIGEAFDLLSEDFEEERFYAEIRRAYWAAPEGTARRQAAADLITKLEF